MLAIAIINAIIGTGGTGAAPPPPVYDFIIAENTDNLITEDAVDVMIIE